MSGGHEIDGRLFVENLRGQLQDLISLGPYFERFEPGQFKMIILDAFYRFLPAKTDENDNGTMASLYNHLDRFSFTIRGVRGFTRCLRFQLTATSISVAPPSRIRLHGL